MPPLRHRIAAVPPHQVLTGLAAEERRLFADRIRALDRRIMPGVAKLSWTADKHALELYFREARRLCRGADACVGEFKAGLAAIDAQCRGVAEGLLINVEKKRLYELPEFEDVQGRHHAMVRAACTRQVHACMRAAPRQYAWAALRCMLGSHQPHTLMMRGCCRALAAARAGQAAAGVCV